MTFSQGFIEILIYGSLIWCAISALVLGMMLIRDGKAGDIW